MALIYSTYDFRLIILDARSRTLRTAFTSEDVLLEILLRKFESCRHAIEHHSDKLAMRLSEDAHSIFPT